MTTGMTTGTSPVAPVLVFAWGNPSRGDDALGPLFIEQAARMTGAQDCAGIEYLTDFQLQVEHALDLQGRDCVLFVDASVAATAPFEVSVLQPEPDTGITTHAMSPRAVMHVFEQIHGHASPPCTQLAIRASRFELGEALSDSAANNLAGALAWYPGWLRSVADLDSRLAFACTN